MTFVVSIAFRIAAGNSNHTMRSGHRNRHGFTIVG